MAGVADAERTARFRTVMALAFVNDVSEELYAKLRASGDPVASHPDAFVTEGILEGRITHEPRGGGGFGYDPAFELPQLGKTLAEMSLEEKNRISHRYRALIEMRELLLRWKLAKER
jgi:XTP/dITP diphosphohydrolase